MSTQARRRLCVRRAGIGTLAALPGLLATGCLDRIAGFDTVTDQGRSITNLFYLVLVLSALVFLLVAAILTYILIQFRAGRAGAPSQVTGNRRLEATWVLTPAALLTGLFVLTVVVMNRVESAPEEPAPLLVEVVGNNWWWEFRYPDLGIVTANELHVPVDTPIRFEITGDDVIHSFWVPQFGRKLDAIPGRTNIMHAEVNEPGVYRGACTEYCGTQHAWMRILVFAQTQEEFAEWVRVQQAPAPEPPDDLAARGREVFLNNTCVNCHAIEGTGAGGAVGPNLTHVGLRETLGAGVVENTPENLLAFIRNAQQVKPGVLMPPFPLPRDDLRALVAYLEGLK